MHWASYKGHSEVCKLLIQNDANLSITNNCNKTPIDGAKNDKIRVVILQSQVEQLQNSTSSISDTDSSSSSDAHVIEEDWEEEEEIREQQIKNNELRLRNEKKALENKVNELMKEKELLAKEVQMLKQNEFTAIINEVKIPQLQKYELLLYHLLQLQTGLLSAQQPLERSQMIQRRNKSRRDIVNCIDEILKDVQTQMSTSVNKLLGQMSEKKLEHLIPIKRELEKDIAMENEIHDHSNQESAQKLEEQIKEAEEDLRAFKRRRVSDKVEMIEQEIKELEAKMQKNKAVTTIAIEKRANPLFGFPEMQSSLLHSINQERIDDLKSIYLIEKIDPLSFFVTTRKDNNKKVFVKKFSKFSEWKQFKNEVETVKRLNHQCVITINRVMYDDHLYYVEMPFIANGTLYNWLFKSQSSSFALNSKNERSGFEVQQMLRLVIQTIDYLHENGVLHRDLKMENIMMQTEQLPVIIDFDMSKDNQNSSRVSVSTMKGGTLKYMDPAVQWGVGTLNCSSDIYSFGVTMLKCFSKFPIKTDLIAMPNKEVPDLKMTDFIVEDEDLIKLLKRCLHIKQEQRPTAQEIIYSPFFLKFLSNENEEQKQAGSIARIEAFKKFMTAKRTSIKSKFPIKLKGDTLIEQLSALLTQKSDDVSLYKRFIVHFEGEEGIDSGALTTSMFRKYFEQLVKLNVLVKGSSCFHVCEDQSLISIYSDVNKRKMILTGIGIMLCKCLYELRSIGDIQLSSVLIKYLITNNTDSIAVSMSDYESFDIQKSNHLSNLHLHPNFSALGLDFSELKENGEQTELTNDNLNEFIQLTIQKEMVLKRRRNLLWIKEGFYKMKEMKEHLQMLEVNDYHILLTGEQMIDIPSIVTNCVSFLGFSNGNLQSGYALNKINIKVIKEWSTNRLPQSHVCFYLLDIPLYTSKLQLEQKLKLAISNTNDSFTMV